MTKPLQEMIKGFRGDSCACHPMATIMRQRSELSNNFKTARQRRRRRRPKTRYSLFHH
jgi:hypothetical protein